MHSCGGDWLMAAHPGVHSTAVARRLRGFHGRDSMAFDLIAFDMDGTLLDDEKHVLPSTIEAIRAATSAGKVVAIATGRSPSMMLPYRELLPDVSYAICTSGAHLLDLRRDSLLAERAFDPAVISQLLQTHKGKDVMLEIFSGTEAYDEADSFNHLDRYGLQEFHDTFVRVCHGVDDIEGWVLNHASAISKYIVHPVVGEDACDVLARIREQHIPVEAAFSQANSLEISPKSVSKGIALEDLRGLLGIPIERCIAVGDSGNDLEMLRAAGLGIAMGNASPDAVDASDVTVADNNHGGCAEAVYDYLLK